MVSVIQSLAIRIRKEKTMLLKQRFFTVPYRTIHFQGCLSCSVFICVAGSGSVFGIQIRIQVLKIHHNFEKYQTKLEDNTYSYRFCFFREKKTKHLAAQDFCSKIV
jgi:hypothetical protein